MSAARSIPTSIDAVIKLLRLGGLVAGLRLVMDVVRMAVTGMFDLSVPGSALPAIGTVVIGALTILLWLWPTRRIAHGLDSGRIIAGLLFVAGLLYLAITLLITSDIADVWDVLFAGVQVAIGGAAIWELQKPSSLKYLDSGDSTTNPWAHR